MKKRNINTLIGILIFLFYIITSECMYLPFELFKIDYTKFDLTFKIVYSLLYELVIILSIIWIINKKVINDFKDYIKNFKKYIHEYFKYWVIAFGLMITFNLIITTTFPNILPSNQQAINSLFKISPIYIIVASVVFAPILEELVFRLGFRYMFKNNTLFILSSGLVFGSMHVISSFTSFIELLYIIPYSIPGIVFAYVLTKSKNIFIPISLHMIHNGLLIGLQVILALLGWFMKKGVMILIIIILIFLLTILYAYFIGTKGLIVKEYKITNSNLPNNFHGLKVVHLSDIHYNTTIKEKELNNVVEKINFIKPDIVVITGDLLDDYPISDNDIKTIQNSLNSIKANLGKYIISGNHDKPIETFNSIISETDFINMDDKSELIYFNEETPIVISGISSTIEDNITIIEKEAGITSYISTLESDYYSILLMHEPDYTDNLNLDNYDLILSGHSHNGQVRLPFIGAIYTPLGSKKYYNNHYSINNTELYISSGLGTSSLKLRLFNKPSINFYRITNH